MSNLTILNTAISQHDNLFNLKDLHKVSGNEPKHEPNRFTRLDTTQALVTAIQAEGTATPIKTLRGTQGGTYACKEIVIAYAAWISPQFHLVVLRAFLNQLENSQKNSEIPPLALPEKTYTFDFTEKELQSLVWAWFAFVRGIHTFRYIYPAFEKLGSNIAPEIYGQGYEYGRIAQAAHNVLERITQDFDGDSMTNWRVLKHLRDFDPAFKKPTF